MDLVIAQPAGWWVRRRSFAHLLLHTSSPHLVNPVFFFPTVHNYIFFYLSPQCLFKCQHLVFEGCFPLNIIHDTNLSTHIPLTFWLLLNYNEGEVGFRAAFTFWILWLPLFEIWDWINSGESQMCAHLLADILQIFQKMYFKICLTKIYLC